MQSSLNLVKSFFSVNILSKVSYILPFCIPLTGVCILKNIDPFVVSELMHGYFPQILADTFDKQFIAVTPERTRVGELELIISNSDKAMKVIDALLHQNPPLDIVELAIDKRNLAADAYTEALSKINANPEDSRIHTKFVEDKFRAIAEGKKEPITFNGEFKLNFSYSAYVGVFLVGGLVSLIL